MNWGRAKTILIVFFLILNLCLGSILVSTNQSKASLSQDTIDSTIQLLEQKKITFTDEDIVPRKKFKNQNYTLTTLQIADSNLPELWLGSGYTEVYKDSVQHQYVYQNGEKKLTIDKTSFQFSWDKSISLNVATEQSNMQESLISKLDAFGFHKNDYYFEKIWFENGLYCATISPTAESTKIIGVKLHVAADENVVVSLWGNWFTMSGKEILSDDGLMDITAVMTNLIYLDKVPSIKLSEISYAFYVPDEYLNNKTITAVPVYVFRCLDGRSFCYDARSGERIS